MTKKGNKTEKLYIRIMPDKKEELLHKADSTGQTLTDLVLTRLDDLPIRDYKRENEFFLQLHELTRQLGLIGQNINQVTIAIHQINNSQKIEAGEFIEFKTLLTQYMIKRNELSEQLEKVFFK